MAKRPRLMEKGRRVQRTHKAVDKFLAETDMDPKPSRVYVYAVMVDRAEKQSRGQA